MPNDLQKISGGVIEIGVDTFTPDFTTKLVLSTNSKNLTTGINQGTAPRYGISPIPGHSCYDTTTVANGRGLRSSENAAGDTNDVFRQRFKFLGILPMSLLDYSTLSTRGNVFLWLIAHHYTDAGADLYPLSASFNCQFTDGGAGFNTFAYLFDISYGFTNAMPYQAPIGMVVAKSNFQSSAAVAANLAVDSAKYFASSTVMSVSGSYYPMPWLYGGKTTNGSLAKTAIGNFVWEDPSVESKYLGIPPSFAFNNYELSTRTLKFYNFIVGPQLIRTYINQQAVTATTYLSTLNRVNTASFAVGNATTAVANKRAAAFVAADVVSLLLNDPALTCDSSYKISLVAAGKPLAYIAQEWDRDSTGCCIKIAQLTDRLIKPLIKKTFDPIASTDYLENGVAKSTCFSNWPSYVDGTALSLDSAVARNGTYCITLGAVNTGVLRANTTYEFTFSIFDKQLGIETNVGMPARFRTANTDFVRLSLLRDSDGGIGVFQQLCGISLSGCPVYFIDSFNEQINFLQYRFYYRPLGSYEWLPALFIDAAQFFYWPDYEVLWACEGTIAGLPGGQPGGFIDYSFLPDDDYTCVVTFRNRAFWLSEKNMVFSLQNNPFAYPLRNTAPAPSGGYKGAIIHTYRGQSTQESRLVIFGQKETYIGRFTGIFQQMPVAVSPDVIASYDVDGSDFTIEPWTSITAFSYRSAVVADGTLFWWGPQGIYRDDGVNVPTKISRNLEPDIFDLYDQSLTDEIHCIYDEKTKDIIWFYPPKADNTRTYAITYDIEDGEFQFEQFDCKIDWATRINTNNPGITQDTNGLRTIIGSRKTSASTVQRGYFFDQLNRSGDMRPETELICKSVTSVSATSKTLGFDSGLDATNFATIAVGDYIAIQQFKKYTGQSTGDDIIAKVTGINLITPSLTIQIPSGATLPACTPTERFYFPIWHARNAGNGVITQGLNGIPWVWESKYWMPSGPDNFLIWLYLYMFFKYTTWKKVDPITFSMGYRTATGAAMISDTVRFRDNSDANFQLFHALRLGQDNSIGQAIKLKLSGTHIGEEWALQYLEAHVNVQDGNYLKQFEG